MSVLLRGFYNKEEYGKKIILFKWFQKIGSLFSTRIVCVSERVKQDVLKNKIAKPKKFIVIKNGIKFDLKETKKVLESLFFFAIK